VPPYYTFAVDETRYLVTFFVMFIVSVIISRLTLRIRLQAEESRLKEQQTAALYGMNKELVSERDVERLKDIAAKHIGEAVNGNVMVLLPDGQGRIMCPAPGAGSFVGNVREQEAAQWALDHHQPAGSNMPTGPDADASYFPLIASRGTVGVLGVLPKRAQGWFDPKQVRYLEAFTNQTAIAIERSFFVEEAHRASVKAEAESMRNTLLSSISHDLRTPLTAITGAVSTLLQNNIAIDQRNREELLQTIQEEADRLNRIIKNILDMMRLESGALQVNKEWQSIEEIVGVVLNRLGRRLDEHPLTVNLPANLPLIPFDSLLLEQVFMNLFENAIKYSPKDTPIELSASDSFNIVTVELADRGPGIPPGKEEHIFEKFAHGRTTSGGVGLGLAICRTIISIHGGKIWAENREGGGAIFRFTLSAAGPPPLPKQDEELETT
jgi:two-component system sensor histidine kinase KdpD